MCEKLESGGGYHHSNIKIKQSSKKNIHNSSIYKDKDREKDRDRVRTDYSTSLQISHAYPTRFTTEYAHVSPIRDKIRKNDFKIELTDRHELLNMNLHSNLKKKKIVTDYKKKPFQNYTVMAYLGNQKKRKSKDKNNLKKVLLTFSDSKKTHSKS